MFEDLYGFHAHSNSNWQRRAGAKKPAFKWVNTVLGNIKSALVGTYRAVHSKHVPRYLAEFEYRFNRRYRLETMIPRLGDVAWRQSAISRSGFTQGKADHGGDD